MAIRYKDKKIPFSISFTHNDVEEKRFHHLYSSNEYTHQESNIEIFEGLRVGIKFYADSPEDFDEEARIEVQTSLYDETDNQVTFTFSLSNTCDEVYWIYQNKDEENFPWRMGTYLMKVYYKGSSYILGFFVKPLYLSTEQVYAVHQYLESKIEGVIYDLVYSKQSMSQEKNNVLTNWYYDYARYMLDQKELIFYLLLSLEKHPLSNLLGENEISVIPGKLDQNSIRWSCTVKGLAKNNGLGNQTYYYNRVKKVDYNNKPNQWIKSILSRWSAELHEVIGAISNSYLVVKKDLNKLMQQQNELYQKKEYLHRQREVARPTKINVYSLITITEENIQKNRQIANQQEIWIEQLRSMYSRIVYILNNTFFTSVDYGKNKPILKSNNYYKLNDIYEKAKNIQKDAGDKKRYIKVLKPFWKIYEYYCLFTVIDCLMKLGYTSKREFNPNFEELYYQSMIPEGTCFEFENEKSVIHCWYDKYHGDKFAAEKSGDAFFTTQEKCRPDIKLDLYEKQEDGNLLFKSCIIFDAKFRKLANMHNNEYATTTYHQLTSYYQFFYSGKSGARRRNRTVVDQVICLYGGAKNEALRKEVPPILYIKLFSFAQENGEWQTKGEEEVLEELEDWLDDL
ncbi:nuclease domain-containing protein [Bacillus sp. FJAT-51639]|uniref:Nuclease domain-containing protein n=1 Tax=Bacillus bruguierae TaxID=3127667 RepID=A0ABU8FLY6_9BACI